MPPDIKQLLEIIEQKLDWGRSDAWQSRDFESLNERIFKETGVSLSASTLRRIWGRVEYKHLPSATTLDALARFAGFESWRGFLKQLAQQPVQPTEATYTVEQSVAIQPEMPKRPTARKKYWMAAAGLLALFITGGVIAAFAFKRAQKPVNLNDFSFSSKLVTHTLPNSVVFTYDATASQEDSVYIQQSWDPNTKTLVDKSLHKHTAVYYEPGYYDAKLLVGEKVVKQHRLLIPTDGWLGIISNKPVPVYLKPEEYLKGNIIDCPISAVQNKNMPLQPQAPIVRFYNVGNFDTVPVNNFSFSADVKNSYSDGSNACQLTGIYLVTDANPIIMQLGIKGCASELSLESIDEMVSGKKADLSGFGVDFSKWATVACKSTSTTIQYFVNGKLAYECGLPKHTVHIVGMQFAFQGTGAVQHIKLNNGNRQVFTAF